MNVIEGEVIRKEEYAFTLESGGVTYTIRSHMPLPEELSVHDRIRVAGRISGDQVDEFSGFRYLDY